MISLLVLALLVPGPGKQTWEAAMCFTGRDTRNSKFYASECVQGPVDYEGFCSAYQTRLAARTPPQASQAACEAIVEQNTAKRILVCVETEGPLPAACSPNPQKS